MIQVVAYQARTAKSAKTGKDYTYQLVEIQQSPSRPNVSFRRFAKSEAEALAPGVYTADISFYIKDNELVPLFTNFQPVSKK